MNIGRSIRVKLKPLLKSPGMISFLAWLLSKYIAFVYKTSSWTFIGLENIQHHLDHNIPFLGTFWHNRLALMVYAYQKEPAFYMMISGHGDGQLISRVIDYFGIKTIYGSSSRGGSAALREAVTKLKKGHCVGITPDGPRGPRYSVQEGAIHIARLAQVDIFTASYNIKRRIVFKSWDRLIFPLPFSKGVFVFSKPLTYEELAQIPSIQEACTHLQTLMIETAAQADRSCGHQPMLVGEKRNKRP